MQVQQQLETPFNMQMCQMKVVIKKLEPWSSLF